MSPVSQSFISLGVATWQAPCAAGDISPSSGNTHSNLPHVTSFLFLLFSGIAKGKSGCARRHGGVLLRLRRPLDLGSSRFRAPSKKAHLGTGEQPSLAPFRLKCPE